MDTRGFQISAIVTFLNNFLFYKELYPFPSLSFTQYEPVFFSAIAFCKVLIPAVSSGAFDG